MDIQKIREDFPILSRTVYGKPLVYFDNGATTQKPRLVVDALVDEYYSVNANVHRGVHYLSLLFSPYLSGDTVKYVSDSYLNLPNNP